MRNLMENPEQYRYLQDNPDKIEGAVYEMLRYNPPFICMRRTATRDFVSTWVLWNPFGRNWARKPS